MYDPRGYAGAGAWEIRALQEHVQAELSDARMYLAQARQTGDPTLRRLWLHLAAEERRHALEQARLLRAMLPEWVIVHGSPDLSAAEPPFLA